MYAHTGPATAQADEPKASFEEDGRKIAPHADLHGARRCALADIPLGGSGISEGGDAVEHWRLSAAGFVFSDRHGHEQNLTIRTVNCNDRKYVPALVDRVRTRKIDPSKLLTQCESMDNAIDAFRAFDERQLGLIKVELKPSA
jgi:hypothetical protein